MKIVYWIIAVVVSVGVSVGAGYMEYLAVARYTYPGGPVFWGVITGVVVFGLCVIGMYELVKANWLS